MAANYGIGDATLLLVYLGVDISIADQLIINRKYFP